jgi:hypothetical protein
MDDVNTVVHIFRGEERALHVAWGAHDSEASVARVIA